MFLGPRGSSLSLAFFLGKPNRPEGEGFLPTPRGDLDLPVPKPPLPLAK